MFIYIKYGVSVNMPCSLAFPEVTEIYMTVLTWFAVVKHVHKVFYDKTNKQTSGKYRNNSAAPTLAFGNVHGFLVLFCCFFTDTVVCP